MSEEMIKNIVFVIASLIKTGAFVGVILFLVAYTVFAERKVSAMMQGRIGPNRAGIPLTKIKFLGLGQPIADALKFLFKEEYTPGHVNKFYFHLAPALVLIPSLLTISVVPFGNAIDLTPLGRWLVKIFNWPEGVVESFRISGMIADIDVGILFVFALVSVSVYGIVLAGWASNSKYPFLGGIRASAQMISYELSMGLAVVPVLMVAEEFNLVKIVNYQIEHGWLAFPFSSLDWRSWVLWIPLGISFIIFLVASFAETNRLPFDIPESEQELIGGYHTEYASMKFSLFFLGEYAAMITVSGVMISLFFGGWSLPLPWFNGHPIPSDWGILGGMPVPWWFGFIQTLVFALKVITVMFMFIWVRWTLPRFRYDQLMNLGWKIFLPLAFGNVFLTAILLLIV